MSHKGTHCKIYEKSLFFVFFFLPFPPSGSLPFLLFFPFAWYPYVIIMNVDSGIARVRKRAASSDAATKESGGAATTTTKAANKATTSKSIGTFRCYFFAWQDIRF